MGHAGFNSLHLLKRGGTDRGKRLEGNLFKGLVGLVFEGEAVADHLFLDDRCELLTLLPHWPEDGDKKQRNEGSDTADQGYRFAIDDFSTLITHTDLYPPHR